MKATNNVDILIGNTEIPISIYSAVESETHFKQVSNCCSSAVKYKKFCESCNKELDFSEISKAIEVGDNLKPIDTEKIKVENSSLKILGLIEDYEEEGVFKNGDVWFLGIQKDKSKDKLSRTALKFAYLRECLRKASNGSLIGLINVRGKEHIVILKPYFNALIGLGIYHFDRIRDVKEIGLYSENVEVNPETLKQMVLEIEKKEQIIIKNIENTRNKLIENAIKPLGEKEQVKTENPLEIVSF